MNKVIAIISIVCILITLSSCGSEPKHEETLSESSTSEFIETDSYNQPSLTEENLSTETTSIVEIKNTEKATEVISSKKETSNSDVDIHMLNLFLSNFSELYRNNYSIDNTSTDKMINFVILNAYYNNNEKFSDITPVEFNGMLYARRVNAEYVQNRVKRFFDKNIQNKSTDSFYYDGSYYYYPAADGEFLPGFSKVTSIHKNDYGNLIVEYNVYEVTNLVDNVIDSNDKIYYGYGNENCENCKLIGSGSAVLNEKYFGEGYANFTVVSLQHSVSR